MINCALIGGGITDEIISTIANYAVGKFKSKILEAIESEIIKVLRNELKKLNVALETGKENLLSATSDRLKDPSFTNLYYK